MKASQKRDQTYALTELNKLAYRLVSVDEYADPRDLLQKIAESALDVLEADLIELYEYQQDQDKYILPQISAGTTIEPPVSKIDILYDDAVFQLIKRSEPLYEKEAQKSNVLTAPYIIQRADLPEKRFVVREKIYSSAAIPLRSKDESMGLMFANFRKPQMFNIEQKEIIELFAKQAAIAIKNIRLFQQERSQAQALAELNTLSQQLISIERYSDSRSLLERIAKSAKEVLKADLIELYEYRQDQESYQLPQISVGERLDCSVEKVVIYKDDAVWNLIRREDPLFEENAHKDKILTASYTEKRKNVPENRFVIREKIESIAAIPLRTEEERMGLMFANYRTPQKFTKEQKELILLFANHVAIALKNTRVYSYVNKKREALVKIGKKLTEGIRLQEDQILELIYEQASKLLDMENFCISLYIEATDTVRFALASVKGRRIELKKEYGWESRSGGKGKTERIIKTKEYLLLPTQQDVKEMGFSEATGHKDYLGTLPNSWLGVPMIVVEKVIGVITTYHYGKDNYYKEDDIEILKALADQAAIAIDNARLYYGVNQELLGLVNQLKEVNQKQKKLVAQLEESNQRQYLLVSFGNQLSSKIRYGETELFKFIHEQAQKFMDTDNMYIALYDEANDTVRFGLAYKNEEKIEIPPRKAGRGRTEEIIRTGKPIFISTRKESEEWYKQPGRKEYIEDPLASWIGVPMKVENKVIGVVASYHPIKDNVYSKNDLEILQSMADLAAITLENARLYQERDEKVSKLKTAQDQLNEKISELEKAQEKIAESEAIITRTSIAADFVHRLNNLAGTIPIWVDQIRNNLSTDIPNFYNIQRYLENIESNTDGLLRAAEQLKPLPTLQAVNIKATLESLVRQTRVQTSEKIEIMLECTETLPSINAIASELANALWIIIENGLDAISNEGKLFLRAMPFTENDGREWVEIQITDSGKGISKEQINKIFSPFYTTKTGHLGYGLWRAKNIIEKLNGNIKFKSQEGKGTTFFIKLPSSMEALKNE